MPKCKKVMLVGVFLVAVVVAEVVIWAVAPKEKEEKSGEVTTGEVAVEEVAAEEVIDAGEEAKPKEEVLETSDMAEGTVVRRSKLKGDLLCDVKDVKAPEIVLKGVEVVAVKVNTEYVEEGATAKDDCDENVQVVKEGAVDVGAVGVYEVKFKARDAAGNASEMVRMVRVVNPADGQRVVYLTFDDGPSEHTARLLDVLKKYNVKATFFVTGYGDDAMIRREFDEGHTVALHTNTHNYAYLYSSDAAYFEDLYAVRDRVQRITGVAPSLIRFPGGSSNTISAVYSAGIMSRLVGEVGRRGFAYADWNVSSGDAGGAQSADAVYNNVISRLGEGQYVVLQHDTKGFSVDAVESIVQFGLRNGYTFMAMTPDSYLAHHGVNN